MNLYWNEEKSIQVKALRGVSFSEVSELIQNGAPVVISSHHNTEKYSHQKLIHIEKDGYTYVIPCVEYEDGYFCKTLYPSQKATKKFLFSKN